MGPKMQPVIVFRELVKPSSSSPNHHPKIHNLSFFDQIVPPYYVPLLFFYTTDNGETDHHRSTLLKTSLSAALSRYYPLAGRIKDHTTVDCNDEGVLFLEARTESYLLDIVKNPNAEILKLLFPDRLCYQDSTPTGPLAVQLTYFKCGGMSIGLCLCHKMMEMATMSSFINDWASLCRNSEQEIVNPEFTMGSLYPPLDLPILKQKQEIPPEMKDCVSRKLVFDGSKIAKLKEMVADQVPNPTRLEVVSSLLCKSAMSANSKASSSGSLKPSVVNHPMNLRTRVSPPVPARNKGNISAVFPVHVMEGKEVELGFLVKEFRRAKTQLSNSCGNTSNNEELYSLILKTMKPVPEYFNVEQEVYSCQSWCGYPFYKADFGWGKPLWVATVCFQMKNMITLIDTKEGGGIEAFISLEEKAMAVLETDQELLSFSCVNPSVLDLNPCFYSV